MANTGLHCLCHGSGWRPHGKHAGKLDCLPSLARQSLLRAVGNTVGEKARTAALEIIESKALAGAVHHAYLRIARLENRIFIDLGNDKWDAVEITAAGWRVVSNPPVKFRRTKNTGELPYPTNGGSLEQLRPFVNPTEDGWVLIQGWLLDCIKGGAVPHPDCHWRTRVGKIFAVPLLPRGH